MNSTGTVYLVGAGPGEPGLITVKGLSYLESADVVVHDRLVDRRLLARVRGDAEVVDVGKLPGGGGADQEEINALLVSRGQLGKQVVRLKGGDPFIFGRGGEEALALVEAGVPFEVVPGVTSAIAAPSYAGIPLTHRGIASSVTFVTGSESPLKADSAVAWGTLAQAGGTLVVLMGFESLAVIADTLVADGRSPDTPVALIEWGSEPHQRTVVGSLSDAADKAGRAGLAPPVVAVIGEVVGLREKLRWFDSRPLYGKRVLVTRSRTQAGGLSELLLSEGAHPLEVATIQVQGVDDYRELDTALEGLADYDWVVFPSANAVEAVFARLSERGRDARAFGSARVAAIGSATADSLRLYGIAADVVPVEFVSDSVVDSLKGEPISGSKVLLPRADIGRETLSQGLAALGAQVHQVIAYRTVVPEGSVALLAEILAEGIDVATFTSSSTVNNLDRLLNGDMSRLGHAKIACIGPVTAATVREKGLDVEIMASEHTVSGLVEAMTAYFAEESSGGG